MVGVHRYGENFLGRSVRISMCGGKKFYWDGCVGMVDVSGLKINLLYTIQAHSLNVTCSGPEV